MCSTKEKARLFGVSRGRGWRKFARLESLVERLLPLVGQQSDFNAAQTLKAWADLIGPVDLDTMRQIVADRREDAA